MVIAIIVKNNPFYIASIQAAPIPLTNPLYQAVRVLRRHGQLSRTTIGELIGYSPSRITAIVNDLLDMGIVREAENSSYTGGRRAKDLTFNPQFGYIVTAAITADKLDVALLDFTEHIRVRRMLPIAGSKPGDVLESLAVFIQERMTQFNIAPERIYGVGVTVAGTLDPVTGTLYDTLELPKWGGYQIETYLREQFPYAVVLIERDTNAMALAEARKGGGKNHHNFVFVNLDHMIDIGIIINGTIYHGATGRAGQISKVIAPGALVTPAPGSDQPTMDAYATRIGSALATVVALIDPELILVGSNATTLSDELLSSIWRSMLDASPSASSQRIAVQPASLGGEATLMGIGTITAERIFTLDD